MGKTSLQVTLSHGFFYSQTYLIKAASRLAQQEPRYRVVGARCPARLSVSSAPLDYCCCVGVFVFRGRWVFGVRCRGPRRTPFLFQAECLKLVLEGCPVDSIRRDNTRRAAKHRRERSMSQSQTLNNTNTSAGRPVFFYLIRFSFCLSYLFFALVVIQRWEFFTVMCISPPETQAPERNNVSP